MKHKSLIPLLGVSLLVPLLGNAAVVYSEDFDPSTDNLYTATVIDGGSTFLESSADIDTGNDGDPLTIFDASSFSNGTFALLRKGYYITTDVIDRTGYDFSTLSIQLQLADSGGWDNSDSVRLEIWNAANDIKLYDFDNLTPGGSNQHTTAYSGLPYAGIQSATTLSLIPTTLSYLFSDYDTDALAPATFRVRFVSDGGTSNTSEDFAVGNISVTAVPEPSTFALLAGMGALGFILYRRRQR